MTVARDLIGNASGGVTIAAPNRSAWVMVGLLMAVAGTCHFNRISMSTAGTARIMSQYGIAPEWMGWVYSAFLISYTACMIPGGWFIDRFGAVVGLAVVLAASA